MLYSLNIKFIFFFVKTFGLSNKVVYDNNNYISERVEVQYYANSLASSSTLKLPCVTTS
jgi:hypothetical protein